ncbi:MAG: hypothetical protein FGM48_03005 [Candidatus Nanopelagicaceae bacterium]|jgi:hypothetical protein|nr:hypothetical protein [Candidatus Nanopelagicaceae bacterium]
MLNQIETQVEISLENRNRATVLFRFFLSLPVFLFIYLFGQMAESEWGTLVLAAPVAAALVARNIYPSWLLTFNHAVMEFGTRFAAYFFLLTDEYPTFERNSKVAVIFPDVEGGKKLNRWLPLVKWFLAIPLYLVGFFYMALTFIATVLAWALTSLTGSYPAWAGEITLNTIRYWNRVYGYAIALVTDKYPSFSLN